MRVIVAVLAGCLLGGGVSVAAVPETPQFRRISVAEGLPSSGVNAIAQDHEGYIWLGTNDGLARYDGVDFSVYRSMPEAADGLPGNLVQALHVDARNQIWVAVEGQGVSRLGTDRQEFQHIRQATHPALGSDEVWAITSTADGALWLGTFGGGLSRVAPDGSIQRFVTRAEDSRSLPADNVLALEVDAAGSLWVGTTAGVARWTGRDFERLPLAALSGSVVFSLSAEATGDLWIGTQQGLDRRDRSGNIAPAPWRDQLTEVGVLGVLKDRQGTRWIATRRGLHRERDGVVHALSEASVAAVAIRALLEDHEGGLWFGSGDRGVLRLPAGWRHFGVFTHRANDSTSLGNAVVQDASEAGPDHLWLVGNGHSLDRVQLSTGRIERFLSGAAAFPYHRLLAVQQRQDGSVWVGHHLGVSRVDPVTREIRHWPTDSREDASFSGPASLLYEDRSGLLWSASMGYGMQARDRDGRVRHAITPEDGKGLTMADPEQLLTGPDDALWVVGGQGVLQWDATQLRFNPVPGAPKDRVYTAVYLPPDIVWLHRLGHLETYRWNGAGLEIVRSIGADAGLPVVESGGLLADNLGNMWLTTVRGLLRYETATGRIRQFGVRDGLPSQEFVNRAPVMTASGIAVAGTLDGLVLFEPARIGPDAAASTLVIDRLSVRRAEREFSFAVNSRELRLGPTDRDLRVSARLLSFADAQAHRYRFRLTGYDPDWVDTGEMGERVFSRLEPGSYGLTVQAANADGIWSEPRSLTLLVDPPWWRTSVALAGFTLLGCLLLLLLAMAYRRRLRRQHAWQLMQQRQRLAEQNSLAKTRFLATLGHEIRTPMTGVLGMAELLLGSELAVAQRSKVQAIQRAGQHLLHLLNDTLDLARIEAGKLSLAEAAFDLFELLDDVEALLGPVAEAKGLAFTLQREAGTPRALCGDAMRVRQIILNLGSNAIKFTEQGHVALRVQALVPHGVLLEVSDTGPGLSPAQQARLFQPFEQANGVRTAARYGGSGLGLAICQELSQAMAGHIEVTSEPGVGSCFRVSLPLLLAACDDVPASTPVDDGNMPLQTTKRILLVEDDVLVAEVVSSMLQGLGHEVVHAPQALAALSLLAAATFDLAFLDLDLPGMDGLQLARLIRAAGHDLPLIALTARTDGDAEAHASAAGMSGFVRKPTSARVLAAAIAAQSV